MTKLLKRNDKINVSDVFICNDRASSAHNEISIIVSVLEHEWFVVFFCNSKDHYTGVNQISSAGLSYDVHIPI